MKQKRSSSQYRSHTWSNIILLSSILLTSVPSLAHLRWFIEKPSFEQQHQFSWDLNSLMIFVFNLAFILICINSKKIKPIQSINASLVHLGQKVSEVAVWRLISALTGVMLVANSLSKVYLAPNIHLSSHGFLHLGLYLQFALGVLFLLQTSVLIPAFLTLIVAVLTLFFAPLFTMVDYAFEFVSLALSLLLMSSRMSAWDKRVVQQFKLGHRLPSEWALPTIRVGTGLTLMILGVHDKLIDPTLGVEFLQKYPLNIFKAMGFTNFSDSHFTLAAGVTEVVLGGILTFGISVRFISLCLAGFFITTLALFGIEELIGHLPIFGIAILFLLRGGGKFSFSPDDSKITREALRFSTLQTQPVLFALNSLPSHPLPVINISYAGIALEVGKPSWLPEFAAERFYHGRLITPFQETHCQIEVANMQGGVAHCKFLNSYSHYLPLIQELLHFSYMSEKYHRLEFYNDNHKHIKLELDTKNWVQFRLATDEKVDTIHIQHLVNQKTVVLSFDRQSNLRESENSESLSRQELKSLYYLLVGLAETHRLQNQISDILRSYSVRIQEHWIFDKNYSLSA